MSYKTDPRSKNKNAENAMLTHNQREFLKSDKSGYSDQNKRDYRKKIKRRVYNTILDFQILFEHWSEKERERVFHDLMDESGSIDNLNHLFALLYVSTHSTGGFSKALKQGVRKAEYNSNSLEEPSHAIRTSFEVERIPKAGLSAVDKFRRGPEGITELSEEEARMLLDALYVDSTLGSDSVAKAELRFEKFLQGEAPEELETWEKKRKQKFHEELKKYREKMSKHYEDINE